MPVDLDDLFTALAGQADAIPLGTADRARRRGRQRTRNRVAALSAAVAVCLVTAGVAGFLAGTRRDGHPVSPPSHALPEVGAPIPLGGGLRDTWSAIAGGRVFTAWSDAQGRVGVVATDPATGAALWTDRTVERNAQLVDLRATSPAVLLIAGTTRRTVTALRPADGRQLWRLTVGENDALVPHPRALVRWSATTRETEGYDWATGTRIWSGAPGGDSPIRTFGMRTAGDPTPDGYTGDAVVQLTTTGRAVVRDAGTGAVRHTTSAGSPRRDGLAAVIDGRLYTEEESGGVRVTDLDSPGGGSAVIATGAGLVSFDVCGNERLCVLDQASDGRTTVAAIDRATGRTLWRVAGPPGPAGLSARGDHVLVSGGGTTVLYDAAGAEVVRTPDAEVGWLTPGTLVMYPALAPGTVTTFRVGDRRLTRLGEVPTRNGRCVHTSDRLICPTATDLRVWTLTG
ncbi:PQQ-binding-like beta-propeller repeat protein [Actinoplanes sp. CA-030573]|uniref:outer membrane protein assembly factor BamB family protein n=1 Tax=Actinoplanes sp. CA-030573 TaxID=3239898 RepID=UPI003D92FF17